MADNIGLMVDGLKEVGSALGNKLLKRNTWKKRFNKVKRTPKSDSTASPISNRDDAKNLIRKLSNLASYKPKIKDTSQQVASIQKSRDLTQEKIETLKKSRDLMKMGKTVKFDEAQ